MSYTPANDEARRAHALSEAIRSAEVLTGNGNVVETAKEFEGYLRGESATVKMETVKMVPPPKTSARPQFPPLPKPSHSREGEGECLACEWNYLRSKIVEAGGKVE